MKWLLIIGCFFVSAYSYGDEILEELSRRSGIPQGTLEDYLAHCEDSQTSMYFCAYRDFIKADMAMKLLLSEKLEHLPQSCQISLHKKQLSWEKKRKNFCEKDADSQAKGGSMRPMALALCMSSFTHTRINALQKISDCSKIR